MKIILSTLLLCLCFNSYSQNTEEIVQASLDAYNAVNIDEFMSYFSADVEMKDFHSGKVNAKGTEEVRAVFEPYFKASPELNSKILTRTVFDNKVIDHEYITGANGSKEPFEVIVIYEVTNDKIIRMTAIRKGK